MTRYDGRWVNQFIAWYKRVFEAIQHFQVLVGMSSSSLCNLMEHNSRVLVTFLFGSCCEYKVAATRKRLTGKRA